MAAGSSDKKTIAAEKPRGALISIASLFASLFDNGFARGKIAARPLPFFVQAEAPVGQNFRRRKTFPGHQFAGVVYMLVTHIELSGFVTNCDQRSAHDPPAAVFRPDNIFFLVIIKNGLRADLARAGVLY